MRLRTSFLRCFVAVFCLCCAALCLGETLCLALGLFAEPHRQFRLYLWLMPLASLLLALAAAGVSTALGRGDRRELRELRRLGAQQARTIDELQGAAERREEFIGGVAHELKTPLTAIIGYADLLRSRDMAPKQRLTAAGYIFSEGRRLEALSKKLLDMIVMGNTALEKKTVDAAWFLRETAAVAAPLDRGRRAAPADFLGPRRGPDRAGPVQNAAAQPGGQRAQGQPARTGYPAFRPARRRGIRLLCARQRAWHGPGGAGQDHRGVLYGGQVARAEERRRGAGARPVPADCRAARHGPRVYQRAGQGDDGTRLFEGGERRCAGLGRAPG